MSEESYSISGEEKSSVKRLLTFISDEMKYDGSIEHVLKQLDGSFPSFDGFEKKFIKYMLGRGAEPITERGKAWVSFASELDYSPDHPGETYTEHNRCTGKEYFDDGSYDAISDYNDYIDYNRDHTD